MKTFTLIAWFMTQQGTVETLDLGHGLTATACVVYAERAKLSLPDLFSTKTLLAMECREEARAV